MNLRTSLRTLFTVIICFSIYLFFKQYFAIIKTFLDGITHWGLLSYTLTYLVLGLPIYIGTYFINNNSNILIELGLLHGLVKSFALALLFALPMLLGGALFFDFNPDISWDNLIAGSIVIGFIEELFYRAFLFGQIYKKSNFGFFPAIIVGAVVFASGHLYQSREILELIGIFSVTFMGAVLFAWLYVEWNYNLWIPIFLHALMNLSWHLYDMDDTALGGAIPNILRGLTIAAAIVFTIVYKLKRKQKMSIAKDQLWIHSSFRQGNNANNG
jgi:membrane protease YdiL (CAAX protease family)